MIHLEHRSLRNAWIALAIPLLLASPAAADQITVWSAPNTHSGQHGASGLVAHGLAHPDIAQVKSPSSVGRTSWPSQHWRSGSFLFDSSFDAFYIGADLTDTGGWNSPCGSSKEFRYSSLWVLESLSGDFNDTVANPSSRTTEILWTIPDVSKFRIFNLMVFPDPNRNLVWHGYFDWTQTSSDCSSAVARGKSRIEIDWNSSQVRYGDPDGTWKTVAIGAQIGAPTAHGVPDAEEELFPVFKSLRHLGSNQIEVWGTDVVSRSGDAPCDPVTSTYTNNTASHTHGAQHEFGVYDMATLTRLQGKTLVQKGNVPLHHIHSDYQAAGAVAITQNSFYDLGSRTALYYGTADARVCDQPNGWNPWSGSSIRFTRLGATGSTYEGLASIWFINPINQNWTCDTTVSQCSNSGQIGSYAFVGAYPLIPYAGASKIYFAVNNWGGWYPD